MDQTSQAVPPVKDGEVVKTNHLPVGVIVVALLTLLNTLPGLLSVRSFSQLEGTALVLTVVLGFLVRGLGGLVGGVQLLRMKKSGAWLASLVWLVAVVTAVFSVVTLASQGFPQGVSPSTILFLAFRSAVVGLVFLIYLWWPTVRSRFH